MRRTFLAILLLGVVVTGGFFLFQRTSVIQAQDRDLVDQLWDTAQRDNPGFAICIRLANTGGKNEPCGHPVYMDKTYLCLRAINDINGQLSNDYWAEQCILRTSIASISLNKALHDGSNPK